MWFLATVFMSWGIAPVWIAVVTIGPIFRLVFFVCLFVFAFCFLFLWLSFFSFFNK